MTATLNGFAEPDETAQPSGRIDVFVIVPQEFVGASIHELTVRDGLITDMTTQGEIATVQASLPSSQLNALVEIVRLDTDGRGRVVSPDS